MNRLNNTDGTDHRNSSNLGVTVLALFLGLSRWYTPERLHPFLRALPLAFVFAGAGLSTSPFTKRMAAGLMLCAIVGTYGTTVRKPKVSPPAATVLMRAMFACLAFLPWALAGALSDPLPGKYNFTALDLATLIYGQWIALIAILSLTGSPEQDRAQRTDLAKSRKDRDKLRRLRGSAQFLTGPAIGLYRDSPFYEWIEDRAGTRYDYSRIAPPGDFDVAEDEIYIAPGAIYRRAETVAPRNPTDSR